LYGISEKYVLKMKLFNKEEVYWKFILRRAQMPLYTMISWAKECIKELKDREMK